MSTQAVFLLTSISWADNIEFMNGALGEKLILFTNTSPIFKGSAVIIAAIIALLFAFWMKKFWKEELKGGFLVFIGIAVFVLFYGLFILVFQPHWWNPPY